MNISAYISSLRGKVVLLGSGSVLIGLLLLSATNIWSAREHGIESLRVQNSALVEAHIETIFLWIDARKKLVQALGAVANTADPVPFLKLATAGGKVTSTYIGYADKHEIDDVEWAPPAGYDPTVRPWYLTASKVEGPTVTEPYVDVDTKKLVVTFAHAVRVDGKVQAVAAADVSMDEVIRVIANIHPTPSSYAFLASKSGTVFVHPKQEFNLKPVANLASDLSASKYGDLLTNGVMRTAQIGDASTLLIARPIGNTDWVLVLALDQTEVMAGVDALIRQSMLVTLIVATIAALVTGSLMSAMLKRLEVLRDAMKNIGSGDGDLTLRLNEKGNDELAHIAFNFNGFVNRMQQVLLQVSESSHMVAHASEDIAASNNQLSKRTASQSSALMETNFALDSLREVMTENEKRSANAKQMATKASIDAQDGGKVVAQVVETMDGINQSSRQIEAIIGAIDAIAFQTNILALNAAVEAARAGEQGRGFAVVASEVRALAARAADAAKEIKVLIHASVRRVDDGSGLVAVAGTSIGVLVAAIEEVNTQVTDISATAAKQMSGISEVESAMGQLDRTTKENAAMVTEVADAAKQLSSQASELLSLVNSFRLS